MDRSAMKKGTLDIRVGGVDLRFIITWDVLLEACKESYKLFSADGMNVPTHRAMVTVSHSGQKEAEEELSIGRFRGNKGYFILAPYFRGESSRDFSEGKLEIFYAPNIEYMQRAVENYIRWVLANILLASGRGLLLHASASVLGGQAHVFLGPHGSGKSTAAILTTNGLMIADDVLPILIGPEGVTAAAMPAVGKFTQVRESVGCYPLGNIYWLSKSPTNRLERLGVAPGTGLLIASAPFIKETENYQRKLFEAASRINDRAAFYNLHFRKEDRFLDVALKNALEDESR